MLPVLYRFNKELAFEVIDKDLNEPVNLHCRLTSRWNFVGRQHPFGRAAAGDDFSLRELATETGNECIISK